MSQGQLRLSRRLHGQASAHAFKLERVVSGNGDNVIDDRQNLLPIAVSAPISPTVLGFFHLRRDAEVAGDLERAVDEFERRFDRDRLRRPALRIDAADQGLGVDLEGEIIVMAGDDELMHRLALGVDPVAKRQRDLGIDHGPSRRDPAVMANRRQRTGLPD